MKKIVPFIAIALAVVAAYLPAVRNGFVWDDTALILRDPLIRSWRLIPEGFQHFLFTDATASDFYRPIQRLTYTLEYCAFAVRPAPYHVTSILCHVCAAIALLLFANELLRRFDLQERTRRTVAFIAALAWAVHPVHTGAVAYVAGRADPLAAAFGFLGLFVALKSDRAETRAAWGYSAAAAALFLCSALSKEMGLIFPLLWCVLLISAKERRMMLRWLAVTASVLVIYLSLRFPAEHIPVPTIHSPPPPLVRPIIVSRALAEYAALLVLPINLHAERDVETHPTGANPESAKNAAWRELETLGGILVFGALVWWALRARKHDRAVFTLLLLAGINYLPVSGIFLLNAGMAEHWIYVPSAFVLLAAGIAIAERVTRNSARKLVTGAAAVWIAFLGVRTFVRTFDWKDQRTFFERTIASGGDSARMLINLAIVDMGEGKLDDAKKHLQLALEREPNHPLAIFNLAAVAVRQQDYKTAHQLLDDAVTLPVVAAQAQELRVILTNKEEGKIDTMRMRLASRTGPPNWQIEKRYIRVLAENGAMGAAVGELNATLKNEWYRAESWQLLGELFQRAGLKRDADSAFARAREYDVHLDLRPKVL